MTGGLCSTFPQMWEGFVSGYSHYATVLPNALNYSTTRVITVITKYNHGVLQVATVLYLHTLQVSRLVGLVLAFSVLFTGETARP